MSVCGRQNSDRMNSHKRSHNLKTNLEDTISEMEERHGALANRRHYLTEKILNMEKTMPMLVAYKLLNSDHDNFPIEKIQEFLDKLSPYPHPSPTEKLLKLTKDELHNLTEETKQLHDKIIETDVKLEETGMELDSLLSVNRELNEKLKSIETAAQRSNKFPDLREIDPDDLVYLGKLRQLVQQEIRLKNCIKALETRENHLQVQLNQLLTVNEGKKNEDNSKIQKMRNKKQSKKCNDHPKVTYKEQFNRNDGVCHCGSEISLEEDNYSTDIESRFTDDESSNEEYCECCDCEN